MMKRFFAALLTLTLSMAALTSCTSEAPASESAVSAETMSFSDYLDLGNKCLSEGNYEEAIIAFTAAIEIDPNIADAYLGRAEAYVFSGETAENLSSALADYENVLAMDETNAAVYLGIADVYIRQSEFDKALEILQTGLDKTGGNAEIAGKIEEIESGNITDSQNRLRGEFAYGENGELEWYHTFTYDEQGRQASVTSFDPERIQTGYVEFTYDSNGHQTTSYGTHIITDGGVGNGEVRPYYFEYSPEGQLIRSIGDDGDYTIYQYDENGNEIRSEFYGADGVLHSFIVTEYDTNGNKIAVRNYNESGELLHYYLFTYDENDNNIRNEYYTGDGMLIHYTVIEYDENNRKLKETLFERDGNIRSYDLYFYNADGDQIGLEQYDSEGNLIFSGMY